MSQHALASRLRSRFGVSRTDLPAFTIAGFTFKFQLLSPGDVQWATTVATGIAGSSIARRVIVRHLLALAAVSRIVDSSDGLDASPWQVFLPLGAEQKDEGLRALLTAAEGNPLNPPLLVRRAAVRAMYDFFAGSDSEFGLSETVVRALDSFYSASIHPLSAQPPVMHQCSGCNEIVARLTREKPRFCEECGGAVIPVEGVSTSPLDVAEETVTEG